MGRGLITREAGMRLLLKFQVPMTPLTKIFNVPGDEKLPQQAKLGEIE